MRRRGVLIVAGGAAGAAVRDGMPAPDAERRALLVLSAIEGALILARARQDGSPLSAVREELRALTQ